MLAHTIDTLFAKPSCYCIFQNRIDFGSFAILETETTIHPSS